MDLSDSIRSLAEILRERTEAEPAHERALREAQRRMAFASEVIASFAEQELHRGMRCRYGLTKAHVDYARSVYAWSCYEADLARWMHDPRHRALLARLTELGPIALEPDELQLVNARPDPPDQVRRPNTLPLPAHWPEDAAEVGAIALFFANVGNLQT